MVRVDVDGVKCSYPSQGTWNFGEVSRLARCGPARGMCVGRRAAAAAAAAADGCTRAPVRIRMLTGRPMRVHASLSPRPRARPSLLSARAQLEFSSEICSGNIAEVEQLDDAGTSFRLTTAPDCAGMPCVTGYR